MRRAPGILDALIKRVEKSGGRVSTDREHPWKTRLRLDGVELRVRILELSRRADHVPTKDEQKAIKEGRDWGVPRWDFTPSGELVFQIEYVGRGVQRTWTDGTRRKFSRHPERLWQGVLKAVAAEKAHIEELEERERTYRERERRAEEERRRQEEERRRFDELIRRVANWERSRQIKDLLSLLQSRLAEQGRPVDPGSALEKWFRWAEACAERLDPVEMTLKELLALDAQQAPTESV